MGCKGNRNRYGFIPLIYIVLAIGYGVLTEDVSCALKSNPLYTILQVFAFIHVASVVLGYYNRKYIFGTKEIVTHSSSWTEKTTYYSGYIHE